MQSMYINLGMGERATAASRVGVESDADAFCTYSISAIPDFSSCDLLRSCHQFRHGTVAI